MKEVFYSIKRRLHPVCQSDLDTFYLCGVLVCSIRGWGKWQSDSELEDESVSELIELWNDIKKDNQEFDIDVHISNKNEIDFVIEKREQ
tara:strand:- start:221 stop:487 length:267 start_codon:yes stop_codon:yes gene_type:complete